MTARVLIVEDDSDIADLVAMYLRQDGIDAPIAPDGESAVEQFTAGGWDLVVLDINLPGMDGYEVLERLKRESAVPVLILSARRDDADVIHGLGIGADDYVTKPFSPKVLVARIRARLRRARESLGDGTLRFGSFHLDLDNYVLKQNGKRVSLAPKEYDLLAFLVRRAGKPTSPEDIYAEVWGNAYGEIATVAVHIQRLRKKLGEDPTNPRFVQTVHGYGYTFNPEELT